MSTTTNTFRPFPHAGACADCREAERCNVCGASTRPAVCTNGHCMLCHAAVCSTDERHTWGTPEARDLRARAAFGLVRITDPHATCGCRIAGPLGIGAVLGESPVRRLAGPEGYYGLSLCKLHGRAADLRDALARVLDWSRNPEPDALQAATLWDEVATLLDEVGA